MLDRDIAGGEVDEPPRNEKRAHPARSLLGKEKGCLFDALQAPDARADQHAGADLVLVSSGLPARVVERLLGGAHGIDNEVVDLALLLGLHPVVRIERAVRAVPVRDLAGNLARQVRDVETLDAAGRILPFDQAIPRDLVAATERRHETQACNDDTSHRAIAVILAETAGEPLRASFVTTWDGHRPSGAKSRQAAVFFSRNLMASPTVRMVSAASSGISQPNSSSKAMTSSTVSRLSAPRSSMKLAFSVTLSASTPRCSTTIFFTRSAISLISASPSLTFSPQASHDPPSCGLTHPRAANFHDG